MLLAPLFVGPRLYFLKPDTGEGCPSIYKPVLLIDIKKGTPFVPPNGVSDLVFIDFVQVRKLSGLPVFSQEIEAALADSIFNPGHNKFF